jgi:hypothetical protein
MVGTKCVFCARVYKLFSSIILSLSTNILKSVFNPYKLLLGIGGLATKLNQLGVLICVNVPCFV